MTKAEEDHPLRPQINIIDGFGSSGSVEYESTHFLLMTLLLSQSMLPVPATQGSPRRSRGRGQCQQQLIVSYAVVVPAGKKSKGEARTGQPPCIVKHLRARNSATSCAGYF